jgi:hypothetical protein
VVDGLALDAVRMLANNVVIVPNKKWPSRSSPTTTCRASHVVVLPVSVGYGSDPDRSRPS